MYPKVSERSKRAHKNAVLSIKLDVLIIMNFDPGEQNDTVHGLNLTASTICAKCTQERFFKAAKVTVVSFSSKVVSFGWHPVIDKMESLLLEWTHRCTKFSVKLSCAYREISSPFQ